MGGELMRIKSVTDNKVTWFLYIWASVCLEFATSFLNKWTCFLQRWIVLLPQDAKTATIFKAKIILPMLSATFKTPHFSYALFRTTQNWENTKLRWIPKQLLAPILCRTWLSAAAPCCSVWGICQSSPQTHCVEWTRDDGNHIPAHPILWSF